MSQSKRKARRRFEVEFKVKLVKRLLKGESVTTVAREAGVLRKDLYLWKKAYQRGGERLLVPPGRPSRQAAAIGRDAKNESEITQARKRIEELERKVGQQELELDFFAKALRCVEATGKPTDGRFQTSLKRKPRKAN